MRARDKWLCNADWGQRQELMGNIFKKVDGADLELLLQRLLKSHSRATTVVIDEDDAGFLKGILYIE